MKKFTAFLTGLALAALVLLAIPAADATTGVPCTPRTAWVGSETTYQGGKTLMQVNVTAAMTLTRVQVSIGYAQRTAAGSPAFSEMLTLVGFSHGPVVMVGPWPADPLSPDFGPNLVTTTDGSGHNENPAPGNTVIGASILKSSTGFANGNIDSQVSVPLVPGDVIWVNYDTLSSPTVPLDPEVQAVITYTPDVCP